MPAAVGSFSKAVANSLLNKAAGGTAYTAPASLEVAALTTMCDDTGAGGVEVSAAGGTLYARITVANNKTTWTTSTLRSLANAIELAFAAAGASWGTVAGIAIYDAADHTTLWGYAEFSVHQPVVALNILEVPIGQLVITLPSA